MKILPYPRDPFWFAQPTPYGRRLDPVACLGLLAELRETCLHRVPLRSVCGFCHLMGITCDRDDCAWCSLPPPSLRS